MRNSKSRALRAWLTPLLFCAVVCGQAVGQPQSEQPQAQQPKAQQPQGEQPQAQPPKAERLQAEQPQADRQGLSLDDALRRALSDHPGLRATGLAIDLERSRRDLDALSRPLTLQTEIENFGGSGTSSDFGGSEMTLQLSKVIERGGKPALRREVGNRRIEQAEIAAEAARLTLAEQVTRRFIDFVALQERRALADEGVDIAEQTLGIVQGRFDVGRSSEADRSTAAVARSRARLERLGIEARLEAARMNLAALWGAVAPDFARGVADLDHLPQIATFASLEHLLAENPDLLRQAAEVELRAARRRLAEAQRQPDLALSGGLRRLGMQDDVALVFSMSMPFGSSTRAAPSISETETLMAQSPLETEARRRALRARLFSLYQQLSFAGTAHATLRDSIIPEAAEAAALYEDGFTLGSSTLLELVEAQERLLTLRGEALEAARDYHSTLAEIEYLLGGTPGVTR